ncbi:hypothetical protein [Streptomyces fuscichromogenes]|uniref:hypothetical protein n=1 Tax=Streptomyces fuscichromogenes TaxID=1324013 RepID=UPI001670B008|nr:hypothetical protein [Streptomyces fuscichromogenes]
MRVWRRVVLRCIQERRVHGERESDDRARTQNLADSSGSNAVAKRLVADGHPVVAAPNPLPGLTFDATEVKTLPDSNKGPIVLVGPSYGGAVIVRGDSLEVPITRPPMT